MECVFNYYIKIQNISKKDFVFSSKFLFLFIFDYSFKIYDFRKIFKE